MGFWTRVRLPPGPLESKRSNTVQISKIAVFKSTFGIELDISGYDTEPNDPDYYPLTYSGIQKWIMDKYDIRVSKGSITMVRNKCSASKIDFKAGKEPEGTLIKSEKEKFILEAFRALGVI